MVCDITVQKLRDALAGGRVFPAFQPVVSLKDRGVSAFEVLSRWTDPDLGAIPPDVFIPVAEAGDLLDAMLHTQIVAACSTAASWPGQLPLAFNVSPRQFRGQGLVDLVSDAAARASFPLSRIQIEITEGAVLDDVHEALAVIRKLKDLGIRIVLDDFGVGYSSLTRLHALPFDKLKIDASFVRSMETDSGSRKIVSAVIGLGQSLGMPVVAEGVETEALAAILERLGCDFAQGHYFGAPMPAGDIPAALLSAPEGRARDLQPIDLSYNLRLAQLRAIFHGVPIGLCFVDRHHLVGSMNLRFAEALGIDPAGSVGRDFRSLLPHSSPYSDDDLDRALEGYDFAPRAVRRPGWSSVALATVVAARDEVGAVIGYTIALIDMYEHRRMIEAWEDERRDAGRAALEPLALSRR